MNFTFSYLTEPKEFSQASFIFIETKPLLKTLVLLVNLAVTFILALLLVKGYQAGLLFQEWFMISIILFWLFARRKFNRWVFLKKFNKQTFDQQKLTLSFSRNGIIWSGEKFTQGSANWPQIKYVIQVKNGFIFALSPTQFLWLPERVFESPSQQEQLITLLTEMKIKIKYYQWTC